MKYLLIKFLTVGKIPYHPNTWLIYGRNPLTDLA